MIFDEIIFRFDENIKTIEQDVYKLIYMTEKINGNAFFQVLLSIDNDIVKKFISKLIGEL